MRKLACLGRLAPERLEIVFTAGLVIRDLPRKFLTSPQSGSHLIATACADLVCARDCATLDVCLGDIDSQSRMTMIRRRALSIFPPSELLSSLLLLFIRALLFAFNYAASHRRNGLPEDQHLSEMPRAHPSSILPSYAFICHVAGKCRAFAVRHRDVPLILHHAVR